MSSLNPSASRFTLGIPMLGRPKKPLGHAVPAMAAEGSQDKDSAVDGTAQASELVSDFPPMQRSPVTTIPVVPDVTAGTTSESQTADSLPHEQPTLTLPKQKATVVTKRNPHQLPRLGGGTLDGTVPTQSILHLSQTHHGPPRSRLPTLSELQSRSHPYRRNEMTPYHRRIPLPLPRWKHPSKLLATPK
ncbi:hypothetical protein FIBSPDRAFT_863931 [Athelia psychrophila]|uniref:Uncharacterized protein n=1 Tax=Athelia psychrophila TaxID=1759441 RepID=A0A166GWF6_9AGAM|nr:hypothetical protein FIBSPDRAFT_863931 [Fibularhizoctonia sp. CBS 109695]